MFCRLRIVISIWGLERLRNILKIENVSIVLFEFGFFDFKLVDRVRGRGRVIGYVSRVVWGFVVKVEVE